MLEAAELSRMGESKGEGWAWEVSRDADEVLGYARQQRILVVSDWKDMTKTRKGG